MRDPYPWDRWFKRGRGRLRRGRDYTCLQNSMAQQVRNAASRRGLRVSVRQRHGGLIEFEVRHATA